MFLGIRLQITQQKESRHPITLPNDTMLEVLSFLTRNQHDHLQMVNLHFNSTISYATKDILPIRTIYTVIMKKNGTVTVQMDKKRKEQKHFPTFDALLAA